MAAPAGAQGQDLRQSVPGATGDGALTVEGAGESRLVLRSDVLTFGRSAELIVDETNPYLHRVAGRFFRRGPSWWLENLGTVVQLEVVPDGGPSTLVPPREPEGLPVLLALSASRHRVVFESGGIAYELAVTIETPPAAEARPLRGAEPNGSPDGEAAPGTVTLAAEERTLLLRLAEPYVRDPLAGPAILPDPAELAEQLGWSVAKLHRKLDHLAGRLCKARAKGLLGARGQLVADRWWRLAEHAVVAGLITPTDLT